MNIADSEALLARLHTDEKFRDRVFAANTMAECMEIVGAKGFSCSAYELRIVMDKFIRENSTEHGSSFTLWGNKIT